MGSCRTDNFLFHAPCANTSCLHNNINLTFLWNCNLRLIWSAWSSWLVRYVLVEMRGRNFQVGFTKFVDVILCTTENNVINEFVLISKRIRFYYKSDLLSWMICCMLEWRTYAHNTHVVNVQLLIHSCGGRDDFNSSVNIECVCWWLQQAVRIFVLVYCVVVCLSDLRMRVCDTYVVSV